MSANLNSSEIGNFLEQYGGVIWYRLHSEREDICEALIREPAAGQGTSISGPRSKDEGIRDSSWHRDLLQARLCNVDDALDRLMEGLYGNCSKCGRSIEDIKLYYDPAIAFCISCWNRIQTQH